MRIEVDVYVVADINQDRDKIRQQQPAVKEYQHVHTPRCQYLGCNMSEFANQILRRINDQNIQSSI